MIPSLALSLMVLAVSVAKELSDRHPPQHAVAHNGVIADGRREQERHGRQYSNAAVIVADGVGGDLCAVALATVIPNP